MLCYTALYFTAYLLYLVAWNSFFFRPITHNKREIRQFYFDFGHWQQRYVHAMQVQNCFSGVLVASSKHRVVFCLKWKRVWARIGEFAKTSWKYDITFPLCNQLRRLKPRHVTYLDFCPKAGAYSRKCCERTRRIKWNCFNYRKLKLDCAVIGLLSQFSLESISRKKKGGARYLLTLDDYFIINRQIFGFLTFYSLKLYSIKVWIHARSSNDFKLRSLKGNVYAILL